MESGPSIPVHAGSRNSTLTERLRIACEGTSYAALGRASGFHPETIRRYLRGQTPDVRFVAIVAELLGWSPCWLLLGIGERRMADQRRSVLADATAAELMSELSARNAGTPPGFSPPGAYLDGLSRAVTGS